MAKSRAEVYFSGIVQGVGFRYNALQVSREFNVTGTVQNLPDRRVKMVVEGSRREIESFVSRVRSTTAGRVTDTQVEWREALGCEAEFRIVR